MRSAAPLHGNSSVLYASQTHACVQRSHRRCREQVRHCAVVADCRPQPSGGFRRRRHGGCSEGALRQGSVCEHQSSVVYLALCLCIAPRTLWLSPFQLQDGTRGLFRGNGVNCMKVMPETAIKMFVFDRAKAALNNDPNLVSGPQRFLAGGFAGAVSQVIVYPLEVIKTRLNLSPASMYSGVMDCFSKTISSEGVRALFRGCSTSVVGIIPYAGIDLMMSSVRAQWFVNCW